MPGRRGDSLPGRAELLNWLNTTLSLIPPYSSIEDCADCVAYGQLLSALYPESVSSRRLRFLPRDKADRQENLEFVIGVLDQVPTRPHVLAGARRARTTSDSSSSPA